MEDEGGKVTTALVSQVSCVHVLCMSGETYAKLETALSTSIRALSSVFP